MTSRRTRWIAAIVGVGLGALVVVWLTGSGGSPLASTADGGYRGLRLLLERQGASVDELDGGEVDAATVGDYDVVFVLLPGGVDRDQLARWHRYVAAGGRLVLGEPDRPAPPTSSTPTPSPETDRGGGAGEATGDEVTAGTCDLLPDPALPSIHLGGVGSHHVYSNERSCYGDGTSAVVTSATCQLGEQFTLTAPTLFDNATMGSPTDQRRTVERRGNAALAARLLAPGKSTRVGIVVDGVEAGFGDLDAASADEPTCGERSDEGSLWQEPAPAPNSPEAGGPRSESTVTSPDTSNGDDQAGGGSGGSGGSTDRSGDGGTGDSGNGGTGGTSGNGGDPTRGGGDTGGGGQSNDDQPPEAGTAKPPPSMFDFLSPGLKLALAQLLAVLAWYAWRRSRRRGVVVEDVAPVELRSSRRVEAVGALRRRNGETRRAGSELREHTRESLAVELGLGRDADAATVANEAARRSGRPVDEVGELLAGAPIDSEDELTALATRLRRLRDEIAAGITGRVGP